MSDRKVPASAIWALGITQIVGYGTLYYSYGILAPAVATELAWSQKWVFAVLSASLLASAVLAPIAGSLADRFGAARLMVPGSLAATAALLLCALAPGRIGFAVGVLAMELASCFVLYSTAFVAIVQLGGRGRSITHLTLIAGFASTLFWPLTTVLHDHLGWREVLAIFAALNLGICLPIHWWLARFSRSIGKEDRIVPATVGVSVSRPRHGWSPIFVLMLAGFAIEGFMLSAILVQMVPLLTAVGLGAVGVLVASLFGPSQVASRLVNMLFGHGLSQTWLAFGATTALAGGLAVLLVTAPSVSGAILFALLFGLGSGLMSIVSGTLPLELFGHARYGAYVGWITAARQFCSAFAPFGLTFMMAGVGVFPALWLNVLVGLFGVAAFAGIAVISRSQNKSHKAGAADEAAATFGAEIV
ncbi:arsenite efflux MFS transporter ArsK [Mesorhizobium sp. AR10]|uniref:arsenite efflux MFS transporter ArsK n=1 Tax=Mesorhizobium sp. AR10 TaxID=2865839 RepID=UPI002160E98D|nr:arsenite efflux MFS transporter ArsK [Mesorhizobium sp. AR10]UVK37983.1 arsenite efflux MFS transporter ArsK [Mesorhizobium sp. AR10]